VLEAAARGDRILVTRNSRDFAPLLREWAETDRHHAGCILIWTLGRHEFGAIIRGVDRLLHDPPARSNGGTSRSLGRTALRSVTRIGWRARTDRDRHLGLRHLRRQR
jgi:hypothetical protein